MKHRKIAFAVFASICFATPSFAATSIKVVEGGEMSLTLDQSTVKAGDAVFSVHNDAMAENHEMVLVRLK